MLTITHCHRTRLPRLLYASVVLCDLFILLDSREETFEGEELWYMASLRLAIWHAQHVQGIP